MNRIASGRINEWALRDVWHAKQVAEPGTDLPADFPAKLELEAAGYTTVEDVDGADVEELEDYAALSSANANAVLAAIAAL